MRWQLLKNSVPIEDPLFDDGIQASPGDEDFSTDAVKAHVAASGGTSDGFNYVGLSPSIIV